MSGSKIPALPAAVQGGDSTIIAKPAADLWPLIADSLQLRNWGPAGGLGRRPRRAREGRES